MPLAHILAPQIAQKVRQIEADLGRTPQPDPGDRMMFQNRDSVERTSGFGPSRSFLHGYMKGSLEEHGRQVQEKARQQMPKKRAPAPAVASSRGVQTVGAPAKDIPAVDPRMLGERDAAEFAYHTAMSSKGTPAPFAAAARNTYNPDAVSYLIPNAPVAAAPRGAELRMPGQPLRIVGERGEAVGVTESGQPIDARGKKLGYLDSQTRTAERRPSDTFSNISPNTADGLDERALNDRFKDHLDVYEENRGRFPSGYFKGKSKDERKAIEEGVRTLQQLLPISGVGGTRT